MEVDQFTTFLPTLVEVREGAHSPKDLVRHCHCVRRLR
jgi:hypothetical protein